MAQISNLNVQVNQNQIGQNQVTPGGVTPVSSEGPHPSIRSGTLVEGQVLSRNDDGSYTVRVTAQGQQGSRTLTARATLDLIPGENFRAVWDASGTDKVPVLRLAKGELSFLSRLPLADRELATALLSRGMPLSDEVLLSIRETWRRMGGKETQLNSLLELWARNLPMTRENVELLSWYMSLNGEAAGAMWERIRKEVRERSRKGENPVEILRGLKEGKGEGTAEISKFLRGHSLLLSAPREDVNPALLCAPLWPLSDETGGGVARVFVGRVHEEGEKRYWQVGFSMEGTRLGEIGGDVESDGRSYNLSLFAEHNATCELLKHKRHLIRRELEDIPLALQSINVSRILEGGLRRQILADRGLDITV
ncbi:MAG: hypothetical protein LBR61_07425 [Synergistaceae bacterium]|nr:hypothetical protein [Synergistaceae bacterium]